jgi:hypothetical protein
LLFRAGFCDVEAEGGVIEVDARLNWRCGAISQTALDSINGLGGRVHG